MDTRESHYLYQWREAHRPLRLLAVSMVGFAVICAVGLAVDDRVVTGMPVWAKPLKFALSFVLYGATLAVVLPMLRRGRRLAWRLGTVIAVTAAVEMTAIVTQVIRGRASHFNFSTQLDAAIFGLMGVTIVVLWLATLGVLILLWREPLGDRAVTWSIRLGVAIGLVGLGLGFLMTRPMEGQLDGGDVLGAHSVGVEDGGPGLPILGWSTVGGDLRIPHFIGMHAIQLLPLFALALLWLAVRSSRLRVESVRLRLVCVAAGAYFGLTGLVTWQALRGEPLIYPGMATVLAAAALTAAVLAASMWALRSSPTASRGDSQDAPPPSVGVS